MAAYDSRYKAGECETVVRELLLQGSNINHRPILKEAEGVATELVDRSFDNLRKIFSRLNDLDYSFANPAEALVESSSGDLTIIEDLEAQSGRLPLVVRKWYEKIQSVDFSQDERQMLSPEPMPCTPVSGLGLNVPLVFMSIPRGLRLRERIHHDMASAGVDSGMSDRFIPLGGWASNCDPKGISLPCDAFDAELYNEGAGPVYFVDELRNAFKWGGFPLWSRLLKGGKQAWPVRCVPEFETLLPILTDGLSPI